MITDLRASETVSKAYVEVGGEISGCACGCGCSCFCFLGIGRTSNRDKKLYKVRDKAFALARNS